MSQTTVSVRELKSRLSRYLRLVRNGESVLITDRGVPAGHIVPVGRPLRERLAAMTELGLAAWSGRRLAAKPPVARTRGKADVAGMLVEDRG